MNLKRQYDHERLWSLPRALSKACSIEYMPRTALTTCPDASLVILQANHFKAPGPVDWSPTLQVVLKELIGELEVGLSAVHPKCYVSYCCKRRTNGAAMNSPSAFVIKETICALLELLRDGLRLLVPLEPGLVLLVEAPALAFKRLCCQILLICSLLVVEGVEQAVSVYPAVEPGVIEDA
jgi:hypothetical protein